MLIGLFLVAAFILFFTRLDAALLEPEEARYAEIPRQMLETDNWIVPHLNGQPYLDKPPLLYWLVMISYQTFGVHEWSARLAASLSAVLCIAVVYFCGDRVLGRRSGLYAAAVLLLMPDFVYRGRMPTMNVLLALWTTAALAAGCVALIGGVLRWRWWLISACACGLGLLTKGPVALALVVPPLFVYSVVVWRGSHRSPTLPARCLQGRTPPARSSVVGGKRSPPGFPLLAAGWSSYLLGALAPALPWYAAVALKQPEFLEFFFWKHNVVRFVDPFDHAKPIWYYLPQVFLGTLPWSLLALVSLALLVRNRYWNLPHRSLTPFPLSQWERVGVRVRPQCHRSLTLSARLPHLFFLACAGWMLLFFSLAGSKRPVYILPVYPMLALALGGCLGRFGRRAVFTRRSLPHPSSPQSSPTGRGGRVGVPLVCCLITFGVLAVAVVGALPWYNDRFSLREELRPLAADAADRSLPVFSYPKAWESVAFYWRRSDVRAYGPDQREQMLEDLLGQPQALLVIRASAEEALPRLPEGLQFVPVSRRGPVHLGRVFRE